MDSPWNETKEEYIHRQWHEKFEQAIESSPEEFSSADLNAYYLMVNGDPVEDINTLYTQYEDMVRRYRDLFEEFIEPDDYIIGSRWTG
jgi:hypothetical protein